MQPTNNVRSHHIIRIGIIKDVKGFDEFLKYLEDNDLPFDFNSIENGIMLQKRRRNGAEIIGDHASHKKYDNQIVDCLNRIIPKWELNPQQALLDLETFINNVNQSIIDNVVNRSNVVNNLTINC